MVEHAYIREEIAKAVKNRRQPMVRAQSLSAILPAVLPPPQERSSFLNHFLIVCILLVSVATIFGMLAKTFDWSGNAKQKVETVVEQKQPQPPQEKYLTQAEAEKFAESVESRMSEIESTSKKLGTKVWLLGIAHNENATMTMDSVRKNHPYDPSDYISFERDWKINRMPRTLKLADDDEGKIRQHVK